jgi:hypothetical protein
MIIVSVALLLSFISKGQPKGKRCRVFEGARACALVRQEASVVGSVKQYSAFPTEW